MNAHELKPPAGSRRPKKRVGRGNSAGQGTTCGRGTKGQLSRSGSSIPAWFEGGQMPLQRRAPKRGFNSLRPRTEVQIVNLADLDRVEGSEFDRARLAELGLVDSAGGPVKVLARGAIGRSIRVEVDACSGAARQAIEAAGGSVELIGGKA